MRSSRKCEGNAKQAMQSEETCILAGNVKEMLNRQCSQKKHVF